MGRGAGDVINALFSVVHLHSAISTYIRPQKTKFNPKPEVESWVMNGARPSGRFSIHHAMCARMQQTSRKLKRRERRGAPHAPAPAPIFTLDIELKSRFHAE
jgi:hypothetical protein